MEEEKELEQKPDNYLVWAILTTIFCFFPFGIVSIVYSARVNNLWIMGLKEEARRSSKNAKTWAIVSGIVGVCCIVLGFILAVVIGVGTASMMDMQY